MRARGRAYLADAARSFERAPVEVALALLIAASFSYAIEAGGDAFRSWTELAITATLAACGAWTATLLHGLGAWSRRRRLAVTLVVVAIAAAYGGLVLDLERSAEAWRAALLLLAASAWVVAVPALAATSGARTDMMRRVGGRFTLRLLAALLYGAALFAGLALALAAVDSLFELQLAGDIYGHVFGWIFLALVPWVVAGGVPDYTRAGDDDDRVASAVHRLSALLVPLLLAIYLAILYAYAVRIGVTGELPKNLVSPLVIAAGLIAALALLLFDPRPAGRAGLGWLRAAPPLFIPLGVLGIWAITLRTGQYGWTEFRVVRVVLLVALVALAVAGTIQLVRRRRFALHVGVLTLAAVLALSAVGPWNATALARRSQQARLATALETAGIRPADPRAPVPADTLVARDVYDQIRGSASYLVAHFGTGALPPALHAHAAEADRYRDLAAALGLRPLPVAAGTAATAPASLALEPGTAVELAASTRIYRVVHAPRRGGAVAGELVVAQAGAELRMRHGADLWTADLTPLLDLLAAASHARADRADRDMGAGRNARTQLQPADAVLPVYDAAGGIAGSIVVFNVSGDAHDGAFTVAWLEGMLFVAP